MVGVAAARKDECDSVECWSSTELNPDSFEQSLGQSIDADWRDGEYESSDAEEVQLEASLERFGLRVASCFVQPEQPPHRRRIGPAWLASSGGPLHVGAHL